jgi:hypothetical protein
VEVERDMAGREDGGNAGAMEEGRPRVQRTEALSVRQTADAAATKCSPCSSCRRYVWLVLHCSRLPSGFSPPSLELVPTPRGASASHRDYLLF